MINQEQEKMVEALTRLAAAIETYSGALKDTIEIGGVVAKLSQELGDILSMRPQELLSPQCEKEE